MPFMNPELTSPAWFARVEALYERLDRELEPHRDLCRLRGVCCDFRVAGHRLYVSDPEARYALERRVRTGVPIPEPEAAGLCPFWQHGRCQARDERPLGCRVYFCDPAWRERGEALYARYHDELKRICDEDGEPYVYGPWLERLSAHGWPGSALDPPARDS